MFCTRTPSFIKCVKCVGQSTMNVLHPLRIMHLGKTIPNIRPCCNVWGRDRKSGAAQYHQRTVSNCLLYTALYNGKCQPKRFLRLRQDQKRWPRVLSANLDSSHVQGTKGKIQFYLSHWVSHWWTLLIFDLALSLIDHLKLLDQCPWSMLP